MSEKIELAELIRAAMTAREHAYAPYSGYKVGAAILGGDSQVYVGCNVENASYGLTICAERAAVCCMVQAGCKSIKLAVVVLQGAGTPCGACRQVLIEFGSDFPIYSVDSASAISTLLPNSFGAADLGNSRSVS
jgi:cytidine deaminase